MIVTIKMSLSLHMYGADHLVAATFVQRNWSAKKKDIEKCFSRNAPFAKRSHSSKGFCVWTKTEGDIFTQFFRIGHLSKTTIYGTLYYRIRSQC